MSKLIIVPGSGKTHYLEELKNSAEISNFYDDFQAKAPEKDKNPRLSRFYSTLVAGLRHGETLAVSDIRYCVQKELNLFIAAVIDAVPEVVLDIRYFKNEPEKCKNNVRKRERHSIELELRLIDEFSPQYRVPSHAISIMNVHD
jgi:hypothetical protein